jgi:hypothetical protein
MTLAYVKPMSLRRYLQRTLGRVAQCAAVRAKSVEQNLSRQPAFVNLQQFYLEWYLVERIVELGGVDLRWKNKVVALRPSEHKVTLEIPPTKAIMSSRPTGWWMRRGPTARSAHLCNSTPIRPDMPTVGASVMCAAWT